MALLSFVLLRWVQGLVSRVTVSGVGRFWGGGVTCYGFCEYDACSDTLFLGTNTLIQESGYKDSLTAARHALQACHGFATHATAKLASCNRFCNTAKTQVGFAAL